MSAPLTAVPAGQRTSVPFGGDGSDALSTLLAGMLQPAQQPKPPGVGKKLLAGVADALMNVANIKSRGAVGRGTAVESQQAKYERDLARADETNRQTGQLKFAAAREDLQVKRAADAQAAIDRRHAEREAAQAALQEDRQAAEKASAERRDIVSQVFDYMKSGGKVPADFDINKATMQDVVGLKNAQAQGEGIHAKLAGALSEADTIIQSRRNMEIGSIDTSTGHVELRPKKTDAAALGMTGPVSPTTARQASTAGVSGVADMTEGQALEALAERKRQLADEAAKARDTKLNKKTERGNTVRSEIISLNEMRRAAQAALGFISAQPDLSGADMAVPQTYLKLRDSVMGSDYLAKQQQLNGYLGTIEQVKTKLLSGSAVSPSEGARVQKTVPVLSDYLTVKRTKLEEMLKVMDEAVADRRKMFGITEDDADYIDNPGFKPSEIPTGAIILGRTP